MGKHVGGSRARASPSVQWWLVGTEKSWEKTIVGMHMQLLNHVSVEKFPSAGPNLVAGPRG